MLSRRFVHAHRHKIIAGAPIIFLFLLGSAGAIGGNVLLLSAKDGLFYSVGDAIEVNVSMFAKSPVNAVGGTLLFPSESMTADSVTRSASVIDLWSEEPLVMNTGGSVHWSGGLVHPEEKVGKKGNVLTVNLRALKTGKAKLSVRDGQLLAHDGEGTNLWSGSNPLTLYIREQGRPSPDVNGDGTLTLTDVNSLYLATFGSFDASKDLNNDGVVDWNDVKLLISLL